MGKVSTSIKAIGILSSIVVLAISLAQYKLQMQQREDSFIERAASHRPQLRLLEGNLVEVQMVAVETTTRYDTTGYENGHPVGDWHAAIGYIHRARLRLSLVNESRESAILPRYRLYWSSATYEPVLRTWLLGDSLKSAAHDTLNRRFVYEPQETVVGFRDTLVCYATVDLGNGWSDRFYTVHVCVPYRNDIGNWYDTYGWLDIDIQALPVGTDLPPNGVRAMKDMPDTVRVKTVVIDKHIRLKGPSDRTYNMMESSALARAFE